ncbi:MAG: hypothetical protein SangKO_056390 [Sandaracinaceae bacterium]
MAFQRSFGEVFTPRANEWRAGEATGHAAWVEFLTRESEMGRPRTVSDEAIRGAAREVFIEAGPAASVGLVAARLGVTQAALFQRVGSKRALMRSALSPSWREARAIVRALEAAPPPRGVDTQAKEILSELGRFLAEVIPNLVVLRPRVCRRRSGSGPRSRAGWSAR